MLVSYQERMFRALKVWTIPWQKKASQIRMTVVQGSVVANKVMNHGVQYIITSTPLSSCLVGAMGMASSVRLLSWKRRNAGRAEMHVLRDGWTYEVLGDLGEAHMQEMLEDVGHLDDAGETLIVKVLEVLVRVQERGQNPECVLRHAACKGPFVWMRAYFARSLACVRTSGGMCKSRMLTIMPMPWQYPSSGL